MGKDKYYSEVSRRFKSGELMERDSINFPDSLKFYTPNKRVVYGGGGIMPDVFIPLDTTLNSDLNRDLVRKGVYNEFVLTYLDRNRKKLIKAYPDMSSFKTNFKIETELKGKFMDFAKKKEVERDE